MNDLQPPPIPLVPDDTPRPLWSVMIPTYNCAHYLKETLASVLAQYPGPDQMQIEVVDDCSTKDDPAAVVRSLSPDGRVTFYRHSSNLGAIANFNACIARSRGHLVHILHGDDFVEKGFYTTIENLANLHIDLALFATRSWEIGPDSSINDISTRYHTLEAPSRRPPELFRGSGLRFPAVVVRRRFYEQFGGFLNSLPNTADMEMWSRAISQKGGIFVNTPLAFYRSHEANDTSSMQRSGRGLLCYLNCLSIIKPRFPPGSLDEPIMILSQKALEMTWFNWRMKNRPAAKMFYKTWKIATPIPRRPLQIAAWMLGKLYKATARLFPTSLKIHSFH